MAEPKPDTQIAAGNFPLAPSNHLGGGLHIYANYSDLAGIAPLRRFNASLGIQSLMALVLTDVNNGGKPNLYIWKESLGQYVEFNSLNIATISGGLDYEEMINDAELALLRDSLLVDNVTAANNSQFYIYSGPNATVSNTHLTAINGLAISTGDWIISTNNVWRLLKQSANALSWNAITGKPDVSINGHTHTIQEITDLADALAAKIGTDKVFQIPTNATSADFEAGATYEQHATSLVTIGSLINWLDDRLNAINSGIPTQITVDTQLDEFSTNAISNSAVFFEFENIYQEIAQLTSNFNDAVQLLNQAIGDLDNAKVSKINSPTSNRLLKSTANGEIEETETAPEDLLQISSGTVQQDANWLVGELRVVTIEKTASGRSINTGVQTIDKYLDTLEATLTNTANWVSDDNYTVQVKFTGVDNSNGAYGTLGQEVITPFFTFDCKSATKTGSNDTVIWFVNSANEIVDTSQNAHYTSIRTALETETDWGNDVKLLSLVAIPNQVIHQSGGYGYYYTCFNVDTTAGTSWWKRIGQPQAINLYIESGSNYDKLINCLNAHNFKLGEFNTSIDITIAPYNQTAWGVNDVKGVNGQRYYNSATKRMYECTSISAGETTWVLISTGDESITRITYNFTIAGTEQYVNTKAYSIESIVSESNGVVVKIFTDEALTIDYVLGTTVPAYTRLYINADGIVVTELTVKVL